MPFKYSNQKEAIVEGRGGGRGLPLTDAEVMKRQSEELLDEGKELDDIGGWGDDNGAKPVTIMNDTTGFHHGRGPGRGHGPDTK
jgi:hypothetical protein